MGTHNYNDAWDDKEFNKSYDLFQEDDPEPLDADHQHGKEGNFGLDQEAGLDKNEFLKFVKRSCCL